MLFRGLLIVAVILTLLVVVLGAYVRLSDAGLGCPDWPGCYGNMLVPDDHKAITRMYPDRPLDRARAWKEMGHRYAAGTVLLLVLVLAVSGWRSRSISTPVQTLLTAILALVIVQALLGMWTVTLLLKPVIVVLHLLGGMAVLSLLYWTALEVLYKDGIDVGAGLRLWVIVGLAVLLMQITLGGWTSANYAALVCPDFPTCQQQWWPNMDFAQGFQPWHGLGVDYEGGILRADARTAIHFTHRIGALLTFIVLFAVAMRALMERRRAVKITAGALLLLLCAQIGIGIANIMLVLPLPLAVAHNAFAALLLLAIVTLLHQSKTTTT